MNDWSTRTTPSDTINYRRPLHSTTHRNLSRRQLSSLAILAGPFVPKITVTAARFNHRVHQNWCHKGKGYVVFTTTIRRPFDCLSKVIKVTLTQRSRIALVS